MNFLFLIRKGLRLFFAFVLTGVCPVWAQTLHPSSPADLESLIVKARQLNLQDSSTWKKLLHLSPALWGGTKSLVNQKGFFLAPNGSKNPAAELEATLRAFAQPALVGPEDPPHLIEHPQCLFRDRYQWLKSVLKFKLPEQPCFGFQEWRKRVAPVSVTLVFSSFYLHNPSSAFGHTLIRLNQSPLDSPNRNPLLDWGVNYAAEAVVQNPFLYGLAGIFGALPGRFSNIPYYLKVQEYNNIESRDLWEYDLNISPEGIDRLLNHLWTLGHFALPYYFFDGNCSYLLLSLLDVAEPSLHLTSDIPGWIIPADTLRWIAKKPGFVKSVNYRPSLATRIQTRVSLMSSEELALFKDLQNATSDPRAPVWRAMDLQLKTNPVGLARVIDANLEYLQYRAALRNRSIALDFEESEAQRKAQNSSAEAIEDSLVRSPLLDARAKIKGVSNALPELNSQEREQKRPDHGHGSFQISSAGGVEQFRQTQLGFAEFGVRMAYHDLNARSDGYPRNAQIELLNFRARYFPDPQKFRMESVSLVKVTSLTPWDSIFQKLAWSVELEWDRLRSFECEGCHEVRFTYARGIAWEGLGDSVLLFAMPQMEGAVSSASRIAPGMRAGARLRVGSEWSLWGEGRGILPVIGKKGLYGIAVGELRFAPSVNWDLRVRAEASAAGQEGLARINLYL